MKTLEHFDHQSKKDDKEHFTHLVQVALADGTIDNSELKMLHRFGFKVGLTEPEIANLIESTSKSAYNQPYELSVRFEQVYDIVKMSLADRIIDKKEMHLVNNLATKTGFPENEIPNLLANLIRGIKEGINEEELFETYKKIRKSKTKNIFMRNVI
jgi:uncharacterized tellurite resistance protein B-like protein